MMNFRNSVRASPLARAGSRRIAGQFFRFLPGKRHGYNGRDRRHSQVRRARAGCLLIRVRSPVSMSCRVGFITFDRRRLIDQIANRFCCERRLELVFWNIG